MHSDTTLVYSAQPSKGRFSEFEGVNFLFLSILFLRFRGVKLLPTPTTTPLISGLIKWVTTYYSLQVRTSQEWTDRLAYVQISHCFSAHQSRCFVLHYTVLYCTSLCYSVLVVIALFLLEQVVVNSVGICWKETCSLLILQWIVFFMKLFRTIDMSAVNYTVSQWYCQETIR